MNQKEKDLIIDALVELKRTEWTAKNSRPAPFNSTPLFLDQLQRNQIIENRIRDYLR